MRENHAKRKLQDGGVSFGTFDASSRKMNDEIRFTRDERRD